MSAATSAISSCQVVNSAISSADKELGSMLNTIKGLDDKVKEFTAIEKNILQLVSENGEDKNVKKV